MHPPPADRALYRRIADDLRQRIASGDLAPGASLPAERDLAAQWGSGRDTVREALRVLVAEGLVETQGGTRARVRETRPMSVVHVQASGHLIGGRGATEAEAREYGIALGAPMLVLVEERTGIEVDAWPADRTRLRPDPSDD